MNLCLKSKHEEKCLVTKRCEEVLGNCGNQRAHMLAMVKDPFIFCLLALRHYKIDRNKFYFLASSLVCNSYSLTFFLRKWLADILGHDLQFFSKG